MFIRKIEKQNGYHISTDIHSIQSFPIHMHEAYEIVFVLEGEIDLKCTAFNYKLSKGDIFIVNVKELHSFSNGNYDNLILSFHLDPYPYLNIFPKLALYLFVCDSFSSKSKDSEKLQFLQQLLIRIYFMAHSVPPVSEAQMEEQVFSLVAYLLNHYQAFYLDKNGYHNNKAFKGDAYQLERISEIQEYIYKNAKEKIDL